MDSNELVSSSSFGIKKEEEVENKGGWRCVLALPAIRRSEMEENDMIIKGREKIGIVVTKVIDGRRHMGSVVAFDAAAKCFKVEYDDGNYENVDQNEFDAIVAPPFLVKAYFNDLYARDNKKGEETGTIITQGNYFSSEANEERRKRARRGSN
ncbi:uncharacterized protein LOC110614926 [Manihot esculenta]|uniref:Uncharacterized protein n=1 Tax=Manihot esculenta TaxID=3983 RepID=A0ACB7HQ61_MANES|nr:uncharacterized protein LOC110614926 [Manihot esculenta]KAG8653933.1 hypothetical protein MANES_05G083733v8 [Manihot esculenta]